MRDSGFIERIEAFCDAVPRQRARAEEHGPLVLFVPTGAGFPYYARPRRGARSAVSAADVRVVRARQRELVIPESFEWISQAAPDMAAAAAEAGLAVHAHPLLVLGQPASAMATLPAVPSPPSLPSLPALPAVPSLPSLPDGVTVRVIAPDDPDLDKVWAVPSVAFGHPGTSAGEAGHLERDKIAADHDAGTIGMLRERLRSGQSVLAAAFDEYGPLAAGNCQTAGDVAEITGVGVLPSRRRSGLGAAVTAVLAGDAVRRGVSTVFLSAADEAVARIYFRIGFRRIGVAMIAEPDLSM